MNWVFATQERKKKRVKIKNYQFVFCGTCLFKFTSAFSNCVPAYPRSRPNLHSPLRRELPAAAQDNGRMKMFDFVDAPTIIVPSQTCHSQACPPPPSPGQYPGQNQGSRDLKIKSSKWFATERLGPLTSLARVTLRMKEVRVSGR